MTTKLFRHADVYKKVGRIAEKYHKIKYDGKKLFLFVVQLEYLIAVLTLNN